MALNFFRRVKPDHERSRRTSDWTGFLETMDRYPGFEERTKKAVPWARRRGITMSPAQALEHWLPSSFELIVDGVERVHGSAAARRLRDVELASVDSREATVSTHPGLDGARPLIVWSNSFSSLLGLLNDASECCEPAVVPDEELATLAVIRIFFLQQMFSRMSTIHRRKSSKAIPKGVGQNLSTWFVLAHEAGHTALGHAEDAERSLDQELEADAFAWPVYRYIAWLSRPWRAPPLTPVVVALLAAEGIEKATFVRRPSSHPGFDQRIDALSHHEPALSAEAPRLRRLVSVASDPTVCLRAACWNALRTSSVWRTDFQGPDFYSLSLALDRLLGAETDTLMTNLSEVQARRPDLLLPRSILPAARVGLLAMVEALSGCGVEVEPEWFDGISSVALPDVIDAFVDAGCWDEQVSPGRGDRIIPSAISALLLRSQIVPPAEG